MSIALAPPEAHRRAVVLLERVMRVLNSPAVRALSRWCAAAMLLLRHAVPGRWVQRIVLKFVRTEAACCRAESPHFKFLQRYLDYFERAGTFTRMRRFLRTQPLPRAAAQLDAWMRIGLLCTLRHEVLNRFLGSPGVPVRLLTEAQIALSPGCDLTCEGCYTAEDRGGSAPRRERMAFLIDEAIACGAFCVHVIGKGEPFLSPTWANELLDVIEARPHVLFTIATHGMHIDDALAARMGRFGNLVLLVAIDGPEPMHDARRGAGSFRRVHEVLARLREHRVVFGYSCMVSAKSWRAVTSMEFIRARAAAGCAVGIYSRYFPLASNSVGELTLDASALADYRAEFESARIESGIPLFDLDEVEQHTGCHSRAGESVYIDGITGQVSPCVRVPFAPAACRIENDAPGRLAQVLSHPFFVSYRSRSGNCPTWCGANLEAELTAVGSLLDAHAPRPERLDAYELRSRASAQPVRRLPVVPSETTP